VGYVYRGILRRNGRRVRGRFELDIAGLSDFSLDDCRKFAAAIGCVYVSELELIPE